VGFYGGQQLYGAPWARGVRESDMGLKGPL